MFNKIFYFIKRSINKGKCTLKQEKGFSLVEVIVAIVIISIITVVLVRGTITAVNVSKMNRAKTLSTAVASEKLELIKCMDYEDIVITGVPPTPEWNDWLSGHTELEETGYIINYEVTWVDGEVDSYKQVEISVSKENMNMKPVSVITQIYPLEGSEEEGVEHPAPVNLAIEYDSGSGGAREIKLVWEAPNTELEIDKYNIYRDGEFLVFASTEFYTDRPGGDNVYSYYVTAVYTDEVESNRSNKVTTSNYPPPQNLQITGYSGGGATRTVHLAWDEPDTELVIVQYVVYREGTKVGTTTDTSYQNQIGKSSYTFYVTAVYEGEIESDPSNTVTTVGYPPPRNLQITGYSGGGEGRKVNLAWEKPDTELVIVQYVVYRGGVERGRTTGTSYEDKIGKVDYTFYVTAVYEGNNESDPSNEVTTTK